MRHSLAGTMNLTWDEIREVATLAEELGFASFYTSDHLHPVAGFDAELGVLDAVALVLALAPVTSRLRLGCLVSPITQRHPVLLARALQTADHISGGRIDIGVGAGWVAEEHPRFGLAFPPTAERLADLDDACAAISALWTSPTPVDLDGRYPLRAARLTPPPIQAVAPLLVAGASAGALRVAARWATAWNGSGSPALVADRVAALRAAEAEAGRAVGSVEATAMVIVVLCDDPAEVEARRVALRAAPSRPGAQARQTLPGEPADAAVYLGPAEGLAEHLARYATAGVDRLVLTTPRPWAPAALRRLAAAAGVGRG